MIKLFISYRRGIEAVSRYIAGEVPGVHCLQDMKISDKHIEVIVRQMLRRVQITDKGDTRFIPCEQGERLDMPDENDRMTAKDARPATYEGAATAALRLLDWRRWPAALFDRGRHTSKRPTLPDPTFPRRIG